MKDETDMRCPLCHNQNVYIHWDEEVSYVLYCCAICGWRVVKKNFDQSLKSLAENLNLNRVGLYPQTKTPSGRLVYMQQQEKGKLKRCSENFSKDLEELGNLMAIHAMQIKEKTMSEEDKKIRAIRESISHWERDILKPLQEGRKISDFDRQFWEDGERLATGIGACALCSFVGFNGSNEEVCKKCPLSQAGYGCVLKDSPYLQFTYHPTLENAQNMMLVLQQVLIDTLEEKRQSEKCEIDEEKEKPTPTIIRPGLWYNSKNDSHLVLFKNQDVQDVWEYYCLYWQRDYVIRVKREDLERQIEEERWIYNGDAKKIHVGFEFDER